MAERSKRGQFVTTDLALRFWAKVKQTEDCWEWVGNKTKEGYGRFRVAEKMVPAHVMAYKLLVGPPPLGLESDHKCRNTGCVRPSHLEWVTHSENVLRSDHANRKKEYCSNGHDYSIFGGKPRSNGKRTCKECGRLAHRAREAGMTLAEYCTM